MKIAIHQPNYLPYIGFFDKMNDVDLFVIYDDAQFNKGDFQHRNKIRIFHGWKWLTVPVKKNKVPIRDVEILNEMKIKDLIWSDSHLKSIKESYMGAPYYEKYISEFEEIYMSTHHKLIDLNMEIIYLIRSALNINTRLIFSSELEIKSKASEKLVNIMEALDGDIYLSGRMGQNYLDTSLFEKKGIKVEYQKFQHPTYKQKFEGFEENMSAIDALFNMSTYFIQQEGDI